jgi:hypothetical protein
MPRLSGWDSHYLGFGMGYSHSHILKNCPPVLVPGSHGMGMDPFTHTAPRQGRDNPLPILALNGKFPFPNFPKKLARFYGKGIPYHFPWENPIPTVSLSEQPTPQPRKQAPKRCSECGTIGHTRMTCSKRNAS